MGRKKVKKIGEISLYDIYKKVRSPFSTVKMTGAGAHKSKKDYNRQAEKLKIKKLQYDE